MATKVASKVMLSVLLACLVPCLTLGAGCRGPQPFPQLSGPYLGQEPPGRTPELFAPDVLTEGFHSVTVFSPDGTEVFWGPLDGWDSSGSTPHLETMRLVDGLWTAPAAASFSQSADSPSFSPDGNRLYFLSRKQGEPSERIWYADRTSDGWSAPTLLAGAISSIPVHWQLSLASNGDLYFGGRVDAANPDIYRAELVEGQYDKVTRLGPTVNTDCWEYSPYVARDGSYLLFSRANAGRTDGDLYVSFPTQDGSWGEALKLPSPINSSAFDHCPWVSDDGKWLFFTRSRNGSHQVFWVDASVIEDLRPR